MSARSGSPKRAASPKRSPKKRARRPAAAKSNRPSTADMVNAAIASLKERRGSSLSAIKKYIAANYKVDMVRMAPFIRRYLRSAVTSGRLRQTKGSGASGSFRLGAPPAKPKAKRAKKAKKPKKARKPKAKKAKRPRKKATKKAARKASPKKARKSKAKRPAKAKAARPRAKSTKAKRPSAKKMSRKSKK